jgi:hypothetical protein
LQTLADAFYTVGNPRVADRLDTQAILISDCGKLLTEITNQILDEALARVQTSTKAVVEAALTGAFMGKEDPK